MYIPDSLTVPAPGGRRDHVTDAADKFASLGKKRSFCDANSGTRNGMTVIAGATVTGTCTFPFTKMLADPEASAVTTPPGLTFAIDGALETKVVLAALVR